MLTEERFKKLAEELAASPGVGLPGEPGRRGFGSSALKVNGSIFAMIAKGRLVLKLPQARVHTLVAAGAGTHFDAGKGQPMKEWIAVTGEDDETWLALAREALNFVGTAHS
jgi:hypothetical protein